MPTNKKKQNLELIPKPDEREVVVRAIANSIQNLSVSGIIQLINEGWIDEQEIDEVLVLLPEAAKIKLITAIEKGKGVAGEMLYRELPDNSSKEPLSSVRKCAR